MSKNIEYTWSVDHKKQKGDSKMNADRYVFTKGSQAKEQAGTILDKLILKFLTVGISYILLTGIFFNTFPLKMGTWTLRSSSRCP